ncbi:MAG: hypothetical protein ACRD2L_08035 [Terriglobia bacterium]
MHKGKTIRTLVTFSALSLSFFTAGSTAAIQSKDGKTPKSKEQAMTKTKDAAGKESPFACNVAGISAEQRPRYMALAKKLISAKQEVRELKDGYAFRFSSESSTIQELAEFIAFERLCCPFFDFEMVIEREGGPAWLRLRGREGVKEFIRIEFGIQ